MNKRIGIGWVIFDPRWHRIGGQAFPRHGAFRDIQADNTLRFEAEDEARNFVQISVALRDEDLERLVSEIGDHLRRKRAENA